MDFLSGRILAFDKPYKMTSFGVVGRVRRLLTQKMNGRKIRVGHAGTLDPLATGVLILCTGRATKQIESLQKDTKEYIAELKLGETTPSFDLEHRVDKTFPTAHITAESFEEAVRKFEGDILQVPPVFSACKVNGDRAYDLARKGRDVQLAAKPIRIEKIDILELRLPNYARLHIVCGKGTYIRSLVRDIGEALQSGAHMTSLRRTRVGDISVEDCFTLEAFEEWLAAQTIEIPAEFANGPQIKKHIKKD